MAFVFFLGGAAALSWQVIWLHHVSLAIGGSAQAMALTVATAMVGMTAGALICGDKLKRRPVARPVILYGFFELAIGLGGLLPGLVRPWIAAGDAAIYQEASWLATPFTLLAVTATIGPACVVMGATIPAIGLVARQFGQPLSRYYGFNTAGAATGALGVAFVLIPALGMLGASLSLTAVHLGLAAICFLLARRQAISAAAAAAEKPEESEAKTAPTPELRPRQVAWTFAFVTGLVGFLLEVAWFRSLRAAWLSTTDTFAILLFCFLVALAIGALVAPRVRRIGLGLPAVLGIAGILVLLVTPLIERFDLITIFGWNYTLRSITRAAVGLLVLGPAIVAIGISLPTLFDEVRRPRDWALLYGWNTVGAVAGSIGAAWVLLPWIGFAATAWLAGGLLCLTALWQMKGRGRLEFGLFAVVALAVAILFESGIGTQRAQGTGRYVAGDYRMLESANGPDVTTSAIAFEGGRALFIDGYAATAQLDSQRGSYMDMMGRLPMLLHPNPKDALVICFGTGQTAHGLRDENPERLTLVDLNPAVFRMAEHFTANRGVIEDERVRLRIMDGRAWLRRTPDRYDIITLEPMPPFLAGTNSLYSVEFYRQAEARLLPGGYMAQWFPIHLLMPSHAKALTAAFVEVFPNTILWIDRHSVGLAGVPEQGILIGRKPSGSDEEKTMPRFWLGWPGFDRQSGMPPRPVKREEVEGGVYLIPEQLARFVAGVEPVTDNNQHLSYGRERRHRMDVGAKALIRENYQALEAARNE